MEGQSAGDFEKDSRRPLFNEIESAYNDARVYWQAFNLRLERLKSESPTTVTREQWMIPLFEILGYKLSYRRSAAVVGGRTYSISHRSGEDEDAPPVHIAGFDQKLGDRPPSGRGTMSPHALVQDYLNRTEHLWGVVTNGKQLRLLRNSAYFTRSAYIEFDIESIMENERLDEFILFYRLVHRTRLPRTIDDGPVCLLERYFQHAIDQGGRIRDGLRNAVEDAIRILGNGFLKHPRNEALRESLAQNESEVREFYRQILYLIYRLLFLLVAEERNLLAEKRITAGEASRLYHSYLGLGRIRALVDEPLSSPGRFNDLYLGLRTLFYILHHDTFSEKAGLPPLNGELFRHLTYLDNASLSNEELLMALKKLTYFVPADERIQRRVNYAALDVEELGSVYESLLDYRPEVIKETSGVLKFDFVTGTERKTTGSYYTRPELVNELVKSALDPVIEQRLQEAKQEKTMLEEALLSIKVCDPACGSGHFLLAAARRIGNALARIRAEEDEPDPKEKRKSVRDVITHCIYGVDRNPLAVDLCRVALWIEGHSGGRPLTFLDHHIRCGDSMVGVFDLSVLDGGIPDEAFNPVTGDDRSFASSVRTRNRNERSTGTGTLVVGGENISSAAVTEEIFLDDLPDETPEQVRRKRMAYEKMYQPGSALEKQQMLCDLWTSAFFQKLLPKNSDYVITTAQFRECRSNLAAFSNRIKSKVSAEAREKKYFHWPVEFPGVFAAGGFDVVACNPPWERIKLQEQEFFATRDREIALAPNRAARRRLINNLEKQNPPLYEEYRKALHHAEALSKFMRQGKRFPLTARGDINYYSVFAELIRNLLSPSGHAGILLPTGIATDDNNKHFFADVVEKKSLVSLYDFENRKALFPGVHRSYKFSLLTLLSEGEAENDEMQFAFFLTHPEQLKDKERVFSLTVDDFLRLNPNTRTCPVFRTRVDAELTAKIYKHFPVLVNERTGENPWGVSFLRMFDMSNDSHLFKTAEELQEDGFELKGNRFVSNEETYMPLYEAKMIWHYDHRFGTYEGVTSRTSTHLNRPTLEQYQEPSFVVQPWYWVNKEELNEKTCCGESNSWFIAFRNIARTTDERTGIFSIVPVSGIGNSAPVLLSSKNSLKISLFITNLSGMVFDFIVRQKVAGTNMNFFYVSQFPIIPPEKYLNTDLLYIVTRTIELIYTSWDIKPFANNVWNEASEELRQAIQKQWEENKQETRGHEWEPPEWAENPSHGIKLPPFKWDEERRALLRAELDAYYAHLYGLTLDELKYILDPADVKGEEFPGETFRVLKEKEIRQYGEYRTRRLILEAWHKMAL